MTFLFRTGLTGLFLLVFEHVAAEPAAVIDFEFKHRSPVSSIQINDVELSLLIDLGGDIAVALTQDEMLLDKPSIEGESEKYQFMDGETKSARKFVINKVAIGSVSLRDVQGREFYPSSFAPKDHPGFIGFGILGQFQLVINYLEKTIAIFDSSDPSVTSNACAGGDVSDLDILDTVIRSKVSFGGDETYLFAWDTGASHNIVPQSVFPGSELPDFVIGGKSYGP